MKWFNVEKADRTAEVAAVVRRLKSMYRKAGYTCSRIKHSPFSVSVYFRVEELRTDIRVSDHCYPGGGTFRGWEVIVDGDAAALEERIADMAEEIE